MIANHNHKAVLKRLKTKQTPLKVLFLVRENAKWTYTSLYEEMNKSKEFEPYVLVSVLNGENNTQSSYEDNLKFFQSKGYNVIRGYDNNKYIDLKSLEPDIVFYDQPYGLPASYKPHFISKYALTCYCPYGYDIIQDDITYMEHFHQLLWKLFANANEAIEEYQKISINNAKNCFNSGYLKLDAYRQNYDNKISEYWKEPEKVKIIYAPHHSFDNTSLKLGTFNKNGQLILELAKQNPETTWIFKPHPGLKYSLVKNKIMTEQEVENYYKEWENLGNVYVSGDYIGIFKTSDLIISDCCSFKGEYLPSKKPFICPVRPDSVKLNKLGEKIMSVYYQTKDNNELKNTFIELVKNGNDSLKEQRMNTADEVFDERESSATKIINHILEEIQSEV